MRLNTFKTCRYENCMLVTHECGGQVVSAGLTLTEKSSGLLGKRLVLNFHLRNNLASAAP